MTAAESATASNDDGGDDDKAARPARRHNVATSWRDWFAPHTRGAADFVLSPKFQCAAQLTIGLLVVTLFVFVRYMRFTQSCLAATLFVEASLLACLDNHVGTKLVGCTALWGSVMWGAALGGIMLSLSLLVGYDSPAHSATLCCLSAAVLALLSVNRVGQPLPFTQQLGGMVSCLGFGLVVILGQFEPTHALIWKQAVGSILMAAGVAASVTVLVGMVVLPSLAADELRAKVAAAVRGVGEATSRYASLAFRPEDDPSPTPASRWGGGGGGGGGTPAVCSIALAAAAAAAGGGGRASFARRRPDDGCSRHAFPSPWPSSASLSPRMVSVMSTEGDVDEGDAAVEVLLEDGGEELSDEAFLALLRRATAPLPPLLVASKAVVARAATVARAVTMPRGAAASAASRAAVASSAAPKAPPRETAMPSPPASMGAVAAAAAAAAAEEEEETVRGAFAPSDPGAAWTAVGQVTEGCSSPSSSGSSSSSSSSSSRDSGSNDSDSSSSIVINSSPPPVAALRPLLARARACMINATAEPPFLHSAPFVPAEWARVIAAAGELLTRVAALECVAGGAGGSQILKDVALAHYFTVDIVPPFRATLSRVAASCADLSAAIAPSAAAETSNYSGSNRGADHRCHHQNHHRHQHHQHNDIAVPSSTLRSFRDRFCGIFNRDSSETSSSSSMKDTAACRAAAAAVAAATMATAATPAAAKSWHWPAAKRELRGVVRRAIHGYWQRVRRSEEPRVRMIESHRIRGVAFLWTLTNGIIDAVEELQAATAAATGTATATAAAASGTSATSATTDNTTTAETHGNNCSTQTQHQGRSQQQPQQPQQAGEATTTPPFVASTGTTKQQQQPPAPLVACARQSSLAWIKMLAVLFVGWNLFENVGRVLRREVPLLRSAEGRSALLRSRVFQSGAKYAAALITVLLLILGLSERTDTEDVRTFRPLFGFVTCALSMSERVEATVSRVSLWVAGTIIGGTLGFLAMVDARLAANPYALFAVIAAFTFAVGCASSYPQLRMSTVLSLVTFSSVSLCQYKGVCGSHGSTEVYGARLLAVIAGCSVPVLLTQLVLPWYTSDWALQVMGRAFMSATKLVTEDFNQFFEDGLRVHQAIKGAAATAEVCLNGGLSPPTSPTAATANPINTSCTITSTATAAVKPLPGPPSSPRGPQHPFILATGPHHPTATTATATAATAASQQLSGSVTIEMGSSGLGSGVEIPAVAGAGAGATATGETAAGPGPEPYPEPPTAMAAAADAVVAAVAAGAAAVAAGAVAGAAAVAAGAAAVAAAVTSPLPSPPRLLQDLVAGPLVAVQVSLVQDTVLWRRGLLATPPVVPAVLRGSLLLLDQLAALGLVAGSHATVEDGGFSGWAFEHILMPLHAELQCYFDALGDMSSASAAHLDLLSSGGGSSGCSPFNSPFGFRSTFSSKKKKTEKQSVSESAEGLLRCVERLSLQRLKIHNGILALRRRFHEGVRAAPEHDLPRLTAPDDALRVYAFIFALTQVADKSTALARTVASHQQRYRTWQ